MMREISLAAFRRDKEEEEEEKPLNDIEGGGRGGRRQDNNSDDDKTTTTTGTRNKEDDTRTLVRTIVKAKRNGRRRSGKALEEKSTKRKNQFSTKVKVYRRKLETSTSGRVTSPSPGEDRSHEIPMKQPHEEEVVVPMATTKLKNKKSKKQKQKVLLKRKLEKFIETEVQVKTRPRTYTYLVTRKHEGSQEFVSSSTEVRQFTYSVTVSKTLFRTPADHQTTMMKTMMTSLVEPTF